MDRKGRIIRYCPECSTELSHNKSTGRYSCCNEKCDISFVRFNRSGKIIKKIKVSSI